MWVIWAPAWPLTGLWRTEGREEAPPLALASQLVQVGTLFKAPLWACRLIRPQTLLGSFGNSPGPLTYGPDKDLPLRDKELFKGIRGSPGFVSITLYNVKCNPYTDAISC